MLHLKGNDMRKKKAIVILSGKFKKDNAVKKKILSGKHDIYCGDGGANYMFDLKIYPKMILGDLDSIKTKVLRYYSNKNVKFEIFEKEKDYTDSELLLEKIYGKYKKIFVYGAIGKRFDHTLANLFLLIKFPDIVFKTERESVSLLRNGSMNFKNKKGKTVSLLPFFEDVMLSLKGFKYGGLETISIKKGDSKGISNIVDNENATVEILKGRVLVVENRS